MKKLTIIFVIIFVLFACKSKRDSKMIKNEISKKRESISKLQKKISKLEKELSSNSNTDNSESKVIVGVKKIEFEKFEHYFSENGSVEAIKDAFISPEMSGQVKKIHVNEGDRVKKGQLLVSLNSDVIERSISEVKTGLKMAETVYKKRKGLWDKKIGSEIQYLDAKTQKESLENKLKTLEARLEMTKIKAPIDGIVDKILKKEGELAIPGLMLTQVVNLKNVYVNADVSEAYLAKINRGDPVLVTFPSYPDLAINAPILRIGNVVNPENRTFKIKIKINNNLEKLKPNILAIIKIRDFLEESALVVPSIIIKKDFKGPYLYVTEGESGKMIARKIYVEIGMSEGGNTIITKGLEPGQEVITEGYNLVRNGIEIKLNQ